MRKIKSYGSWGNSVYLYEPHDDINHLNELMRENGVKGIVLSLAVNDLAVLTKLDFLEEIHIPGNNIKDIELLYSFNKLQRLHLLNDDTIRIDLSNLPQLEEAVLIRRNGVDNIFNHNSLKKILLMDFKEKKEHEVCSSVLQSIEFKNSNIPALPALGFIESLKEIIISGLTRTTDTKFLKELINIERISISACKKLEDSLISEISQLATIKRLCLSKMGDISGISSLINLKNLERLNITENTKIVDGKISFLRNMEKLNYLNIQGYNHYDSNVWTLMADIRNKNNLSSKLFE